MVQYYNVNSGSKKKKSCFSIFTSVRVILNFHVFLKDSVLLCVYFKDKYRVAAVLNLF